MKPEWFDILVDGLRRTLVLVGSSRCIEVCSVQRTKRGVEGVLAYSTSIRNHVGGPRVEFVVNRSPKGVVAHRTYCPVGISFLRDKQSTSHCGFKTGIADATSATLGGDPAVYWEIARFLLRGFP